MLLNDLLCVRSQHTKRTFQSSVLTLSTSMRAEQRIYNSTVELLDLQAPAVIPRRCKEAISEILKVGMEIFNTTHLGAQCREGDIL